MPERRRPAARHRSRPLERRSCLLELEDGGTKVAFGQRDTNCVFQGLFVSSLTHHGARDLVVRAAALVILAHGVALAAPGRVEAVLTAAHAGLWKHTQRLS